MFGSNVSATEGITNQGIQVEGLQTIMGERRGEKMTHFTMMTRISSLGRYAPLMVGTEQFFLHLPPPLIN